MTVVHDKIVKIIKLCMNIVGVQNVKADAISIPGILPSTGAAPISNHRMLVKTLSGQIGCPEIGEFCSGPC